MKAVWFSTILLILVFYSVFANAYYIRKTAAMMTSTTEALSDEAEREQALSSLKAIWKKHRNRIGFSVGFRELDQFDEALCNLEWAHDTKRAEEFERHRRLLLNAIEELTRAEQLNWKCLF